VTLWRTVAIGRWCVMVAPSVRGRCWLLCRGNSFVASGRSLLELVGSAVRRLIGSTLI
jgi:hypothetical protein